MLITVIYLTSTFPSICNLRITVYSDDRNIHIIQLLKLLFARSKKVAHIMEHVTL